MIIEKAKFPDYHYEFYYSIFKDGSEYFLEFDFYGPEIDFLKNSEATKEIFNTIGVDFIDWKVKNKLAKVQLHFPEKAYI